MRSSFQKHRCKSIAFGYGSSFNEQINYFRLLLFDIHLLLMEELGFLSRAQNPICRFGKRRHFSVSLVRSTLKFKSVWSWIFLCKRSLSLPCHTEPRPNTRRPQWSVLSFIKTVYFTAVKEDEVCINCFITNSSRLCD